MIIKNIYSLLFSVILLFSCGSQNSTTLTTISSLPKELKESSGIINLQGSDSFWMINDSGNKNELFEVTQDGIIKQKIKVENAKNKDWEDLASNGEDIVFIGDFGNNENKRKNLAIYAVRVSEALDENFSAKKTTFHFEDQQKFPPKKKNRNFDAEAFIYYNNYFYVFTKNRSEEFDGTTKLYKILAEEGEQIAKLIGKFKTCDNLKKCQVTGADISSDGKKIALLMHDKILLFSNYKEDSFFKGKNERILLKHNSQKEAVCFVGDKLFITDERTKKTGGNLYELKIEN